MTPDPIARLMAEAEAQGLPRHLDDPAALHTVAVIVQAVRRRSVTRRGGAQ
jgi:hypothetical protein